MTLPATGARASDDFDNALRKACAEGAALTDARLLDLAQAAYRSLVRTAPGRSCDGRRVEGLLADLRASQRRRAQAIERARLHRLAAVETTGRRAVRRRNRAYEAYLAGLRRDPLGDGARAGLRLVLVGHPSDAEGEHCERARRLVDLRLLWEARVEIARGMALGREPACRQVRRDLVAARTRAYRNVHQGLAAERSGDVDGARAHFIRALADDPGAFGARAGLRRTRPPLPTQAPRPQVVARLHVGTGCEDDAPATSASGPRPAVVSRVTVRVAAGDRHIRVMRYDRERGQSFRWARDRLLRRAGLPPPDERPIRRGYNAQDRSGTIDLAIRDGVGEVVFVVAGVINERRVQYVWPWIIRSAEQGVAVRPVLRRSPPGSSKRAEVASCVWRPVLASPVPPSDGAPGEGDGSALGWDLRARPISERPRVTLEAPLLDRWSLAGSSLAATVRFAGSMFIPAVLFWFARRRLPATALRLRLAATLGLLAFVALVAALPVLYDFDRTPVVVRILLGLVPAALVFGLYWTLAPPATWRTRLVLAAGIVVSLAVTLWSALATSESAFDLPGWVVVAPALVLVAFLAFALLTAAMRAFALGLGPPREWRRPGWRRVAYAVIVLAALAQAGQYAYERSTNWYALGAVFEGDELVRDGWLDGLVFSVVFQPFDALAGSAALLVVMGAGVALAALRLTHDGQRRSVLFDDPAVRRLVTVVFAAVAVGSSAPLLGIPVPVAFLLSMLYLRLIRSHAVEEAEAHAREHLGGDETADSILSVEREQLLARAAGVHRELRLEHDLFAKYGAGDAEVADQSTLDTRVGSARARADALRRGDPTQVGGRPPLTVPLPEKSPPEAVALAIGPTGDWWWNGRESVKLAWPLIALPVAFSVYVLIDGIVDRGSMATLVPSATWALASVARETAFWIVSAFTLGALLAYLPSRNSLFKGLWLSGAYIVPLLLLQLVALLVDGVFEVGRPFHLEVSDWSFRGFELVLFLMILGARLDSLSVKESVAGLVPLYGLDALRSSVVYVAPVVLTVVVVGGQFFRGEATGALQTILENAGSFLPAGSGLPGGGR